MSPASARNPAVGNSKSLITHSLTKAIKEHCFGISIGETEFRIVVTYSIGKVSTHLDADQHRQITTLILHQLPKYKLTSSSKRNTKDNTSRTLYLDRIDTPKTALKALSLAKPVPPERAAKDYITANLHACAVDVLSRASTGVLRYDGPIVEVDRLLGHQSDATKAIRLIQQACVAFVAGGK